jgi:hypothetical protein
MIECAKWYVSSVFHNNAAVFFTANSPKYKEEARHHFGDSLFMLEGNPVHSATPGEKISDLEDVFVEWWIIGEGDIKIISDRSSFGYVGADRTLSPRFAVGPNTQCSNSSAPGWMNQTYIPLLDSYKKHGVMLYVYEQ